MRRSWAFLLGLSSLLAEGAVRAAEVSGDYLESRTCDVYTGPCFANAQTGLMGSQAIMAWSIDQGEFQGVDLTGMKAVLVLKASSTLTFGGGMDLNPTPIRSLLLVDENATEAQREALRAFVVDRGGEAVGQIVKTRAVPIEMSLDHVEMVGKLKAGKEASIETRKLAKGDCVCSNEKIFYPPLASVENSEPAYTLESEFNGRGLGATWTSRKLRSAYLATF